MERILERLEACLVLLECLWRIKECEDGYVAKRAYGILEEFLSVGGKEDLEEVRKLAKRIDEVLKEGECHEVQ